MWFVHWWDFCKVMIDLWNCFPLTKALLLTYLSLSSFYLQLLPIVGKLNLMSAPKMFGGQQQQQQQQPQQPQVHNFTEPQNVRSSHITLGVQRESSPESPALDLKCYGTTVSTASNNNNNTVSTPGATSTAGAISAGATGQPNTNSNSGGISNSNIGNSNNNNPNSPIAAIDSPTPTERPATPADTTEPENLSTHSDKDHSQQLLHREIMDTGRCTPMPGSREYGASGHSDAPHHRPPPLLGPSPMYPPFSAVRPGSFYPIEHYFPHPGNHSSSVADLRHGHPPPPTAKTPPR